MEGWPAPLEETFEECVQLYRRKRKVGEFGNDEKRALLRLLRGMLLFEPSQRMSAAEVMESEWMTKYAFPDYEQSLTESLDKTM